MISMPHSSPPVNNHLLSACSAPGTVLGAENAEMSKTPYVASQSHEQDRRDNSYHLIGPFSGNGLSGAQTLSTLK